MRALMVTDCYYPWIGGGTTYVHEVSRRLVQRGHEVHVLMPRWEKTWQRKETIEGVQVFRHDVIDMPLLRYWTQIFNIQKDFRQLNDRRSYDVIVFHQFASALGVVLAVKKTQIRSKLLWTFHGPPHKEMEFELKAIPFPPKYRVVEWLYKKIFVRLEMAFAKKATHFELRSSDKVVVLSQYTRKELWELAPDMLVSKTALIPGGVDVERFRPCNGSKDEVRRRLGLPTDKFLIFTIRRLVPRMGLENLIQSLSQVLSKYRDAMLVIGGRGCLERHLKGIATGLGLEERVRFAGFIADDQLPLFYQAADLFVLPTVALEGFGLPILEAMACGIPALVTPVGASPEIVRHFDPRMVTSGTSPQDIARAIIKSVPLLRDQLLLSKQCREFVVRQYSWDKVVGRLERLYLEVSGLK